MQDELVGVYEVLSNDVLRNTLLRQRPILNRSTTKLANQWCSEQSLKHSGSLVVHNSYNYHVGCIVTLASAVALLDTVVSGGRGSRRETVY